jgi:hypothetical protein
MSVTIKRVCPVLLTCARNLTYSQVTSMSYEEHVGGWLPPPMVVVDITAGSVLPAPYLNTLVRLKPRCVSIHNKQSGMCDGDSVNHAAFFALQQAMSMLNDGEDHILFLEDDIVFSSQFSKALKEARFDQDMAFYTFYQPFKGYGEGDVISSELINSGHFFGTQCIMFPVKSVELLLKNQAYIEKHYPPCYDLRWSRFLDNQQRVAYTALKSYVQHIGTNSRLGCMAHVSSNFVP